MTPEELAAKAETELKQTTITYQAWKKKVADGAYNPPDGSTTRWGKAFAALDEIQGGTQPPPEPEPEPGPIGAKLPPPPSVYKNPPTQTVNVALGTGDLNGTSDKFFKFAPGTRAGIRLNGDFSRCIFDFTGVKIQNPSHDGIKLDGGSLTDCWIRNYEIVGAASQGVSLQGSALRVWLHGIVRDNVPNFSYGGQRQFHGYYVGSMGVARHLVISGKVINQRNGYGVQAYQGYDGPGGLIDSVVTAMTFQGGGGGGNDGDLEDVGICVLVADGSNVVVANSVADRCKRQLAAIPGWAGGGPVILVQSAEVGQTGADAESKPIVGTAGSSANMPGAVEYRPPWDTRSSGIGAV